MSKILLISSNTTVEPLPVYPLGMALIAAALEENGHTTKQFDALFNKETAHTPIEEVISDFNPDFIGVSIRNIDNVDSLAKDDHWYLAAIKNLIKDLKRASNKPVIIGGPAFSIMPDQILNFTGADFGIVGEGEKALPDLVHDLLQNKNPDKIIHARKKQIDGDGFYSPLYEKALVDFYLDKSGIINYQTKRGCPYACNYCTYPIIEGNQFRMQDSEFVVDNLIKIKKQFDVQSIFFTDSVFNDSQNHFLEIAEALIRHECKIKWAAYFKPQKISASQLQLLKKSGLYAMEIGSDAACDTTLKGINKSFCFDEIIAMNDSCVKAKIACAHFFMFGGPGETNETVKESLQNIGKLNKSVISAFSGIRILPGTGIQKIAINENIIEKDNDLLLPHYYISPCIEKEKMEDALATAFKKKKGWFFPPHEEQVRMRTLQLFGYKGLLWDRLINFSEDNTQKRRNFHN